MYLNPELVQIDKTTTQEIDSVACILILFKTKKL